jgi:hypothetical protein
MTLLDILITVMIIALAASFWRVRDYAELARNNALQYCSKHQLVFVSVARRQIHWKESPEQPMMCYMKGLSVSIKASYAV